MTRMDENTWIQPDGSNTTYPASGAMVTGYQRVNGTPYFFRASGLMGRNVDRHLVKYAERHL